MHAVMNTYGRLPVTFVSGKGSWLYNAEGQSYLDALSGIAVCGLGHAHPNVTAAIATQAEQLIHTSNLYGIERQQALAEKLQVISGMDNVFFSNSGAEANECAIKIARKYGHDRNIEQPKIIVMTEAFHGRTLATLSATGNEKVQAGFGPLVEGFIRVPYQDKAALETALATHADVVAVMLEPIQGEGGLATASVGYLESVRQLCTDHQALMILDEIQTGNGRTGHYFCYQHTSVLPDVLTTAKGLGNGVPIGACLARGEAAKVMQPGNHGSTYGGNPLACAAALAVIDTIEQQQLTDSAERMGAFLRKRFTEELAGVDSLLEIRGKGLMIGLVMSQDCPQLMTRAIIEQQLLLNVTAGNVIRLLPPLNVSQDEAEQIVQRVVTLIKAL